MTNLNEIDPQLLNQALAGDREAFGDLYEQCLNVIYRYVSYRVSNVLEAEDLTEDVFVRAWQALDRNPPRPATFRAWLYRIAQNTITDYYRRQRDAVDIDEIGELTAYTELPESHFYLQERSSILKEAIESLKPDHQEVIICRFVVGLSHAETAIVMQRQEEAVRALQYRALKGMRHLLKNLEYLHE